MTLTELVTLAKGQYGARFKINSDTMLILIDQLQKMAFGIDQDAFLIYEDFTVLQQVTMSASGYTSAVSTDIGKTVTNGTVTGTLRYYNNTTRKWAVETTGTFSGAITITTGTGAGTFSSQAVYQGPYDWPDTFRTLLGLTSFTDKTEFGTSGVNTDDGDYGLESDNDFGRSQYVPARNLQPSRTITFVSDLDDDTTYRLHGYRKAPTLASSTDEDNFIIPEECRWEFFTALGKMSRDIFNGDVTDMNQFEALFKRLRFIWRDRVIPNGFENPYISEGQL